LKKRGKKGSTGKTRTLSRALYIKDHERNDWQEKKGWGVFARQVPQTKIKENRYKYISATYWPILKIM
jgi:hypothetical protein